MVHLLLLTYMGINNMSGKKTNAMTPHSIGMRNEASKASKQKLVAAGGANISATVDAPTAALWHELKRDIGAAKKPAQTKEALAYAIGVAHSVTCGIRATDDMGQLLKQMVARWDDGQAIDDLLDQAQNLLGK